MDSLKNFFRNIYPITKEEEDLLIQGWTLKKYRKKEVITPAGNVELYVYIVLKGVQRAYYLKDGKEFTIVFTYPPSFCGSVDSLLSGKSSEYFIESITESILVRRKYSEIIDLAEKYQGINHMLRKTLETAFTGVNRKNYELLAFSMEEKFDAFYKRSAHLINLVPHKYIASYLGMDPTNFSKVLKSYKP